MPGVIPEFLLKIDGARKGLRRVASSQLHSQKQRGGLRSLVEEYFNKIRPAVFPEGERDEAASEDSPYPGQYHAIRGTVLQASSD